MDEASTRKPPFPETWVNGNDFIMVHPAMIKALGGNMIAAAIAARLHFLLRGPEAYERDGVRWLRLSQSALAEDLGITRKQVRTSVALLVEQGYILTTKHFAGGNADHTFSYRLNLSENRAESDVPHRANRSAPQGTSRCAPQGKSSVLIEEEEDGPVGTSPRAARPATSNGHHPVPAAERTPEFLDKTWDVFVREYPRKDFIEDARAEFEKAVLRKGVRPGTINRAATYYARACRGTERRYRKKAANWLMEELWDRYDEGPLVVTAYDRMVASPPTNGREEPDAV